MKKVYIIPHTHWDREWYLPFEQHRLRLIWLIDTLLSLLDKDPEYAHFHLDGQTIILDDYLKVKPYNEELLKKHIQNGRLSVGPWYVLQDEYLISDEANVRNMLIGLQESRKYGEPAKIGYFPDAFGNISQAPQILRGFGIDNAIFGRGINAVGFNNSIKNEFETMEFSSELKWQSPDGSEVLGIFMANWYNNSSEIPSDTHEAVEFLNNAIRSAEMVATTDILLLMNGCDHQPVQEDLPDILNRVSSKFPDTTFVHAGLMDYVDEVRRNVRQLKIFVGEMNSQHTEGWWTLTGTASSRIYLKQMNDECQKMIENYLEPIETIAFIKGKNYAKAEMTYAWKMLLQNHPHDSICGCSIDAVHREMVTRFEKVRAFTEGMLENSFESIIGAKIVPTIDLNRITVSVYNPVNWRRSDKLKFKIDLKAEDHFFNPEVRDAQGNTCPSVFKDLGIVFDYTLPKDSFRVVAKVHRYEVEVIANDLKPLGMTLFSIVNREAVYSETVSNEESTELAREERILENDYLKVEIEEDGALTVLDKASGISYTGLNRFEDSGDIGNEYMFIAPIHEKIWKSEKSNPKIECIRKDELTTEFLITYGISLPVGCNKDSSKRNDKMLDGVLHTHIKLMKNHKRVDIATTIDNIWKDHRLRVLMPVGGTVDHHFAHGQYDVLMRPNSPWKGWKNPSNCQKQRYFVAMQCEEQGLMIANKGLMEYEVVDSNTFALTLLRSVGELGDWGVFPTPEAQCLGERVAEYSIIPYSGHWRDSAAYKTAYEFNLPSLTKQVMSDWSLVELPFVVETGTFVVTAVKSSEERNTVIFRGYSVDDETTELVINLKKEVNGIFKTSLNEERLKELEIQDGLVIVPLKPKEIATFEIQLF